LASLLGVPRIVVYDSVGSTLDVAHDLATAGAPSGTLVLADTQTAGRGRGGKRWTSEPGVGIWLTLVERNVDAEIVELLALRLGLAAASALEPFAEHAIKVKWPNDLYVAGGKLAGILVEARWRDAAPEWAAIGLGVNVAPPGGVPNAAGLRRGTARVEVLRVLIPALRAALTRRGALDSHERDMLARRDMSRGRAIERPGVGRVEGISERGELLVRNAEGTVDRYRAGSLVFMGES
jgi:BirA family biotin operon repressor/biotin-[acetyl-CoA-carboxylase] ligase